MHFNKVVFRTPTFSYSFIRELTEKHNIPEGFILSILKNDAVREAVFLASPSLLKELEDLGNSGKKNKEYIKELEISLAKYVIRMVSRCTPFGLFAGFSLGEFSDSTEIVLKNSYEYRSHTRFDMNYLVALSLDLLKMPQIRNSVKFYPNSSIYRIKDKLRYIEYKYVNAERMHNIVSVDNSEYLEKILKGAEKGADINALCGTIVEESIDHDAAAAFINELIDCQLLVSEIEPSITGDEYLHQLLSVLRIISNTDEIVSILNKAMQRIEEIDSLKPGESAGKYIPISEMIKPLGTDFKINYLFQTDLYKPAHKAVLNKKIADDVLAGIEVLSKLTFEPSENNLSKFIEKFEKKYGDREVCILEALDPELGVGFLSSGSGGEDNPPLLEKLPVRMFMQTSDKIYWNKYIEFIDKKIIEALKSSQDTIIIKDEELKGFDSKLGKMAATFSVVARILGKTENGDDLIYISSAGGSNSAYLLGRFCHADKATELFTRSMVKKEEELLKDSIVAEIVHLAQDRVGNVLLHPQFHEYEIPYLARPNADVEHQIKPDDLYISLSGKDLILRSKRLNKKVIPRLSNAHNFSFNAQPVYQFLCEMQFQNILRGVGLPLGNALDRYRSVPRIIYKNIILHLAEWKVEKKEIEQFLKIKDGFELREKFSKWRVSRDIPALVSLEEGDNTLLLNLDNSFCIEMLLSSIKGDSFKLVEFIFDEKSAVVKSDEGSFVNEFIISYHRDEA